MQANVDSAGGHHLLKHTAPSIERVVECFDGAPVKEISKLIMRMGQRELQAKFNAVYGTVTRSNNNDWLRRKLFESIGVKTSNKSKTAAKRDNKIGPAKTNRIAKVSKPSISRSSLSSPDYNEDSNAPFSLAPPESPATVTHGDGVTQTPFSQQMSPMLAGQPMSAASAESGYMSSSPAMHARTYPMQRFATVPPQASGSLPPGYGPVRIVYAPSHMPMHAPMQPPMVRLPSSSATSSSPQHSFPATYFVQPMGTSPPPPYGGIAGHSGSLSSMVSADGQQPLAPFPYAPPPNGLVQAPAEAAPPMAVSPGLACMHDVPPPAFLRSSTHGAIGEDAIANSSDEEHTHTFLHGDGDAACGIEPAAGGKRIGGGAATIAAAASTPRPSSERNPWAPAACGNAELLVSNPVFDSAPLEALGCGIADGDAHMCGSSKEDSACGMTDVAASSCDEGGHYFSLGGVPDGAADPAAGPSREDSPGHSQLDDAIGSLLEASFTEGFGDTVAQVTRTMTRVGCCLVQWHHMLETAP